MDLKKIIAQGVDRQAAQQWPVYGSNQLLDRTNYVTASNVGYCARKVKLDLEKAREAKRKGAIVGITKSDSSNPAWGMFERGHNVEEWVVRQLELGWGTHGSEAFELRYTGDRQVSFVGDIQSGTPDGLAIGNDAFWTIEIKSLDPRTNFGKLPKPPHVMQCVQNMDLVSASIGLQPLGAKLLYIDASNYSIMKQSNIEWSEIEAQEVEDRANNIYDTDAKDLEPEGLTLGHCRFCDHTALCGQIERAYHDKQHEERQVANENRSLWEEVKPDFFS